VRRKVVICLLIVSAALAAPKLKIAFIGIEPSGVSESVASGVSISFRDALVNTHRFEVVERERLAALMEEQGLSLSGCVTTECFVQVGQLAGAQKVIVGEAAQVGGSYIVSVRMVDVYSGRVEQSLSEVSRSLEGLLTTANILAIKLSEAISVEGTVVSVSGKTIKTDLGSQDGVNVNDTVYLVRLGKEHYHPETGLFLGRDIRELGTATITFVLADELSEAVLEGTYSVVVGDKVRLSEPVGSSSVAGRIAFQSTFPGSGGRSAIFVMDADGSNQTQLTTEEGTGPAWSPDGRRIAFASGRTGRYEIWVMDADGSNQTQLTDNESSDFSPTWSPDGRRIAFVSGRDGDREIFVIDADGRNQTQLTFNDGWDENPAWSPDGQRIAFVYSRKIFVMDADGSNQTQLTLSKWDNDPAWSPDGRRIAFASTRTPNWEIFVMDADGSNQTQLTFDGGLNPAWSPDGQNIAFVSSCDVDYWNPQIFVMDDDGSNQTQLTDNGGGSPAWCPVY
jgi:dipeptidyl aminopeptidase/acylaminoacyl peptidase